MKNAEKYKKNTRIFKNVTNEYFQNVDEQATEEGMIPAPAATAVMSEVSNHPTPNQQSSSIITMEALLGKKQ